MWSSERNENLRSSNDLNEEGFLLKLVSKFVVVERYDYIKRKRFTEPQTWTYEWDGAGQLIAVSNNEQNIEMLRRIQHLLREKGMTIEGASAELRQRATSVESRTDTLLRLRQIRKQLADLRDALD